MPIAQIKKRPKGKLRTISREQFEISLKDNYVRLVTSFIDRKFDIDTVEKLLQTYQREQLANEELKKAVFFNDNKIRFSDGTILKLDNSEHTYFEYTNTDKHVIRKSSNSYGNSYIVYIIGSGLEG